MPAYVILEIDVTDPVQYEEYKKLSPGSLALYEGKFIVRGGKTETLEGDWKPNRIVVVEFPSVEKAKAWYNSPEYTAAKQIRWKASTGKLLLVEGL
jgi:uncharacterized protein (DUF1330 family)